MHHLVGDEVGRGGACREEGEGDRKLHVTGKSGNDRQGEQGRGLKQEGLTKSGWEGVPRPFVTRGVDRSVNQVQRRARKRRGGRCRDERRRAKEEAEREMT
jgi:hypothetical protein